jgi:hypothetical protein
VFVDQGRYDEAGGCRWLFPIAHLDFHFFGMAGK